MARGKGNRRKRGPPRNRDQSPNKKARKVWQQTPRQSEVFFSYYKSIGVVPDEEWEKFCEVIVQDLPTTFRVSSIGPFSEFTRQYLDKYATELKGVEVDGEAFEPPTPLSWYPKSGGWYVNAGRGALRKHPALKRFHECLTVFSDSGAVTRQEAVSMIPPLLLDVKSHHRILDMCAAPGSKTSQMVELMHEDAEPGTIPTGLVVANDIDEKRCYMMIHQVNRLSSPCVIATNHEAQKFPCIRLTEKQQAATGETRYEFDRILADVPCTGDGTLRKNFDLWGKWNPAMALGIHRVQLQIASRGMKLLKVGGRMVYSTCSMNPLEDEAVVCELLRRAKGTFELVDVSDQLPELKRANGISSWKVMDKKVWYEKFEDIPDKRKNHVPKTLFPPTPEEVQSFHLERCLRMLPHFQNTGGFFVAVLKKVAPIPEDFVVFTQKYQNSRPQTNPDQPAPQTEAQSDSKSVEESESNVVNVSSETGPEKETSITTPSEEASKPSDEEVAPTSTEDPQAAAASRNNNKPNARHSKEEPFLLLDSERWKPTLDNLRSFYGIKSDFPTHLYLTRSEGKCPRIYMMTESGYQLLLADEHKRTRIVNMGLRVFGKHSFKDAFCPYRINSEALDPIVKYLGDDRKVNLTLEDLVLLLTTEHPHTFKFSEVARKGLDNQQIGGVWFSVDLSSLGIKNPLYLSGWRGKVSAHLLGSSIETRMMKFLFVPKADPTPTEEEKSTPDSSENTVANTETSAPASEQNATVPETQ